MHLLLHLLLHLVISQGDKDWEGLGPDLKRDATGAGMGSVRFPWRCGLIAVGAPVLRD